ncbi:MAG: nucleoside-diphosphate sugar epimerase/dehydratase [Methanothrix sp.]|jgi:FlaA1/EpsC-like NDP-sugar epimerase|uniref:polysaccharide biosynthesis protein n=1 Tax=Methanothrix sp. TaxID=90426 RepID=UPI00247E6243|nr:nucleoside-diphosphate sugar epimerase/dehydratase [Methanothrix sp.]
MREIPAKSLNHILSGCYRWVGYHRKAAFTLVDSILIIISMYMAFWSRFDGAIPQKYYNMMTLTLPLVLLIKLSIFHVFRIYRFIWRHIGLEELLNTAFASAVASLSLAAMLFMFRTWTALSGFPRSVIVIDFAFTLIGMMGVRLGKRSVRFLRSLRTSPPNSRRAIIVGAGTAGEMVVRALLQDGGVIYWPVGFLDDDQNKQGLSIHGVPVLGPISSLPAIVKLHSVETVLIAMPSAPSRVIKKTVDVARRSGITDIKTVPFLSELYAGQLRVSDIREVRPEDVLPREPVSVDLKAVEHFLKGKKVLVTGAAGSIGSELCRQVLRFQPTELLALDFDETGLFNLENNLRNLFPDRTIKIIVGDIRDRDKMHSVFQREHPEVVFHAAAYKHVPMMEAYPEEAVKTNVFGTKVLIEETHKAGAEAFVLISTDKAVNPVSIMGMTKRVAEVVTLTSGNGKTTRCIAVRFGNVLGSRGSVIPTFIEQIRRGGPVTVTHPDMERYFMTIPEAVLLVLQAGAMGRTGEVFVLDMGKPVKILDIARELIRFHGLEPDRDIPIVFTGIRPGERLREDLLTAEEGVSATTHRQIYIAKMGNSLPKDVLQNRLEILKDVVKKEAGRDTIKKALMEIIYGHNMQDRMHVEHIGKVA